MAVPIEKKKKTKWYVTLKPLKHVSKFVYGPYFRPKRDFLLPFSDMKWWCPYEAKKCPIPYVGSREHKPHPISDQKGLSLHPILDQKGPKPYPLALRIPMQPGVFEQLTSTGSCFWTVVLPKFVDKSSL